MTDDQLVELARLYEGHPLSDVATIARARSAVVDVRTTISKSRKSITESQRLVTLIVGPTIKIDPH